MTLWMKHFHIFASYWKIQLLVGGGGSQKTNLKGGLPKKGGLDSLQI